MAPSASVVKVSLGLIPVSAIDKAPGTAAGQILQGYSTGRGIFGVFIHQVLATLFLLR